MKKRWFDNPFLFFPALIIGAGGVVVFTIWLVMTFVLGPANEETVRACQAMGGHVKWLAKGYSLCIDQDGRILE